ncbi:site-specific DNA-methyltransferase [Rhizobium ruizarguesonis]|uniref:site-specific DNA-methyltransferase n=1 Tax=Rhizobium ruizarguesonis TaxID=2081791 RepID=UPI0010312C50|nr:site-specific DNA-methyltransferase [Rhizobium ruizarguesonis]TBA92351.1 site-specific DNA-methyltransferase [Rhizobium ruizarguesonis]TBB13708.1 site-specific DNA-methyltransferase [Rhizobium ruizarguesonis]
MEAKGFLPEEAINLLWLALSRTIITKTVGASLAWDVSHSRPHKKRTTNDYDVFIGFRSAVNRIVDILKSCEGQGTANVDTGDARDMSRLADRSIDAIFTSPPYLNAIDYLRGHKLSLVWMGYSIPDLRSKRSGAVGAERIERGDIPSICERVWREQPALSELPANFQGIVRRYVKDASAVIAEYARVIKGVGQMGLVIGDSTLRGKFVSNSGIFDSVAKEHGFKLMHRETRDILQTKRYLPTASVSNTLEKRMRQEIVAIYSPA